MKKTLLLSLGLAVSAMAIAQVSTERHLPIVGVVYSLNLSSSTISDAPAGANQSWNYTITTNKLVDYEVVNMNNVPADVKSAVPTAVVAYKQTGTPNAALAEYDFFSDAPSHLVKVGTKNVGASTQVKNDTSMEFGQQYNTTKFYGGLYRWYCGYGTLTVNGKVYKNVAMIKSYNAAAFADTLVQFHQFSPFYHLMFSYTKGTTGIKNVAYLDLTNTSVGIEDQSPVAQGFSVYPNPAKDVVTVALPSAVTGTIEIFNLTGQLVRSAMITPNQPTSVPVSDLAPGIYMLKAGDQSRKLIIG
ncbi:MAG: T9SS type A sorting domain-containing protein [Bacteroidota bacterium]